MDLWSYGAFYFYTTFIRAITSLPQIRQVARLRSTTCNLQGLSPTRKEHTNNPVQKPNFRGQRATKLRDNEMEALKRFPTKGSRMNDSTLKAVSCECRRHPGPAPAAAVPAIPLVPVANSWTCTSAHAAQTQASTTARTASLGGSLFCSRTCPEQGSHSVVFDGSLFQKEQGGHTLSFEPRGAATA